MVLSTRVSGGSLKKCDNISLVDSLLSLIDMYGGMGGGGNAWMKIMGISGDQVGKRQAAKEKGKQGKDSDKNQG